MIFAGGRCILTLHHPKKKRLFGGNDYENRIGCDHGGYELKQFIMKTLEKLGYEYEDFGCYSLESCDYPDFGAAAARAVLRASATAVL